MIQKLQFTISNVIGETLGKLALPVPLFFLLASGGRRVVFLKVLLHTPIKGTMCVCVCVLYSRVLPRQLASRSRNIIAGFLCAEITLLYLKGVNTYLEVGQPC